MLLSYLEELEGMINNLEFCSPMLKKVFIGQVKDKLEKIKELETSPQLESLLNKINTEIFPTPIQPTVDINLLSPILEKIESLI